MINENSEVYKQRQSMQELRRKYREHALKVTMGTRYSPNMKGALDVMENGAYVECMLWIPKDEL